MTIVRRSRSATDRLERETSPELRSGLVVLPGLLPNSPTELEARASPVQLLGPLSLCD